MPAAHPQLLDMGGWLEAVLKRLGAPAGTIHDDGLRSGQAWFDPVLLERALTELVANAKDFVRRGQEPAVEVRVQEVGIAWVHLCV